MAVPVAINNGNASANPVIVNTMSSGEIGAMLLTAPALAGTYFALPYDDSRFSLSIQLFIPGVALYATPFNVNFQGGYIIDDQNPYLTITKDLEPILVKREWYVTCPAGAIKFCVQVTRRETALVAPNVDSPVSIGKQFSVNAFNPNRQWPKLPPKRETWR